MADESMTLRQILAQDENAAIRTAWLAELAMLHWIRDCSSPNWGSNIAPAFSGVWQVCRDRAMLLARMLDQPDPNDDMHPDEPRQQELRNLLNTVEQKWRR